MPVEEQLGELEFAPAPPGVDSAALLVLVLGPFAFDRLDINVIEGMRSYTKEVTQRAEDHWQSVLKEKPNLFDGPNWSLVSREVQQSPDLILRMALQKSSYKFMLYTHLTPMGRALVPPASRCNGIGLMALTETSDGFLVYGLRSRKAGAMPLHWHCVPAGILDDPDPVAVLRKELMEETNQPWDQVQAGELMAVMSTGEEQGHKPELVFRLRLTASAVEVHMQHRSAEDKAEHEALAFIRAGGCDGGDSWQSLPLWDEAHAMDIVAAAATSPLIVEPRDFASGIHGPLTDVSRRALLLLCSLPAAPMAPLPSASPGP